MEIGEYVSLGAKFFARRWGCNFLYMNSDIDEDAIRYVVQETERMRRRAFLFFFLQTENGNAASAQSIVSYLNEKYHWVSVVALERCRGAGAAMCTGFHELWVSEPNALQAAYQSQVPFHTLGFVEIHREFMTAAARWMMALKLWSVLSARMAIRLNSLSLQKKFSIR